MRSCKRAGRSWSRVGCGRSCDEDAKHRDIPRVYVAADCAVLEQRSCRSDTQRNGDMRPDHAQRQRHRRSRRASLVLRQVLMHRHRRGHSTRTRVASSSAAPPPPRSFHEDCKGLRRVLLHRHRRQVADREAWMGDAGTAMRITRECRGRVRLRTSAMASRTRPSARC